ncbi:hypothetical protein [Sporosarcina koreensis]|uniref:hypothetical protein n=1 Tax=Bacillales TaxID=1385 RepID=UPI00075781D7|nr:hypothetical protein [Sporosarcina koreensis]
MLVIVLAVVVIVLIATTVIVTFRRYKNELLSQDWYDELYYKFQSSECPHEKRIKFSETDWKFHFSLKRERTVTVQKGMVSKQIRQYHFRFFCEECGKQRWFEQSNPKTEINNLYSLRLKYLFLAGASILLILFITSKVFTWFL